MALSLDRHLVDISYVDKFLIMTDTENEPFVFSSAENFESQYESEKPITPRILFKSSKEVSRINQLSNNILNETNFIPEDLDKDSI